MWFEYLAPVMERTYDHNAKRIMLYLAKHGTEERNRKQIAQDQTLRDRALDDLLQKRWRPMSLTHKNTLGI